MIVKPCDICLEETCEGRKDCNCSTCTVRDKCPRFLHATIRITNKCTQKCGHCCFASSPDSNIMMTIEKAEEIKTFLINNNVLSLNIMGGEFFCNPNWYEILTILIDDKMLSVRLVSNGDWANNDNVKEQLEKLINNNKTKLKISISKDNWHTNKNIEEAKEFLDSIGAMFNISEDKDLKDEGIVPLGRSQFNFSFYSSMGCYCKNIERKYSFLIDEEGKIYKCSFGVWNYANILDYLDGGFAVRFKEFNKKFYGTWISSCASCSRGAERHEGCCVKTN